MKKRYFFYIFLIVTLSLELLIIKGYANPVVGGWSEDPITRTILLTGFFLIGTSIEYSIFKIRIIYKQKNRRLLFSCFKINIITFPLTQILAYIIYRYLFYFFWIYILVIEILVIFLEWSLFRIELNKIFQNSIINRNILETTIIANIASFLLGLLALFFPLYPLFQIFF